MVLLLAHLLVLNGHDVVLDVVNVAVLLFLANDLLDFLMTNVLVSDSLGEVRKPKLHHIARHTVQALRVLVSPASGVQVFGVGVVVTTGVAVGETTALGARASQRVLTALAIQRLTSRVAAGASARHCLAVETVVGELALA